MAKKITSKNKWKRCMMTTALCSCLAASAISAVNAQASANDTTMIDIERPQEWTTGETTVSILVDSSHLEEGVGISKIEAKVGKEGKWQDVTESKTIAMSTNATVYVRVTDTNGTVYEQNRSIKCYDEEKPTLSASLTDGVMTIKGVDSISGIHSITVNGNEYTELKDDGIQIQLTQKDFATKQFEITAKDQAGNVSDKYVLKNPYYEWAVKQTAASNNNMTTNTPTSSTTEKPSAPLPQSSEASKPTEARGTVEDKTVTKIEETVASTGEQTENITKTGSEGGKEFFTISTKSGKIFYLIIDNEKSQDNVYFLTEASERDLMNFTLSDTVTLPEVNTVYAEPEKKEPVKEEQADNQKEEEKEVEMPEDKSPLGSYLLIGLLAVGVGAAGYYFKIYKPKHEYDDFDDEDENEGEDPEESEESEDTDTEEVLEDEEDDE